MNTTRRNGLTLIELLVVIAIVAVLVGLLLGGVQAARMSAARAACTNNLRQLGLSLHAHHDAYRVLPPGAGVDDSTNSYPLASWAAFVLPYLEQEAVSNQIRAAYALDRNFGSPAHATYRGHPIKVFGCPSDPRTPGPSTAYTRSQAPVALTAYVGVAGGTGLAADGPLFYASRVRFADVTDGQSNTLLLGERPPGPTEEVGWCYAGAGQDGGGTLDAFLGVRELNTWIGARMCYRGPYAFGAGRADNPCDVFHFWSRHPGGAHFAFCDGSVRFLRYSADSVLPALATRAGGEVVEVP